MGKKKILIATAKPFAKVAVEKIKEKILKAKYELILLERYEDKSKFLSAVEDVDALIVRSDKVTKDILDAGKKLKIVVRAGAGYDNVDTIIAKDKEIVVMNTPGQNSNAVAELAIGMMLFNIRNRFNGTSGTELRGKTIGIHAYGNVGKCIARIAKGFEMKIYAYDPYIDNELIKKDNVIPVSSVEELYKKSQYISLHIPANEKTKNSINYDLLNLMPHNATLVNTARKEVICEESLLKILEKRDDFKYISDIAPDCKDELEKKYADRVLFTPKKMGAQTLEANVNAGVAAATQIINYFENNDKTFQVNK